MQVTAYVALGTNLGDLRENLDGALQRLRKKGLQITKFLHILIPTLTALPTSRAF